MEHESKDSPVNRYTVVSDLYFMFTTHFLKLELLVNIKQTCSTRGTTASVHYITS